MPQEPLEGCEIAVRNVTNIVALAKSIHYDMFFLAMHFTLANLLAIMKNEHRRNFLAQIPVDILHEISGEMARQYGIIPVAREAGCIVFLCRTTPTKALREVLKTRLGGAPFRLAQRQEYPEYSETFEGILKSIPALPSERIDTHHR